MYCAWVAGIAWCGGWAWCNLASKKKIIFSKKRLLHWSRWEWITLNIMWKNHSQKLFRWTQRVEFQPCDNEEKIICLIGEYFANFIHSKSKWVYSLMMMICETKSILCLITMDQNYRRLTKTIKMLASKTSKFNRKIFENTKKVMKNSFWY